MPIRRSQYQSNRSLEEFYEEVANEKSHLAGSGPRMLKVLSLINEMFPETELVGVTSHYRLCILAEDSAKLDWRVIISNVVESEYYIEYKMPPSEEPWSQAFVTGTVSGFENLRRYLVIAMNRTKAWEGNVELQRQVAEMNHPTAIV